MVDTTPFIYCAWLVVHRVGRMWRFGCTTSSIVLRLLESASTSVFALWLSRLDFCPAVPLQPCNERLRVVLCTVGLPTLRHDQLREASAVELLPCFLAPATTARALLLLVIWLVGWWKQIDAAIVGCTRFCCCHRCLRRGSCLCCGP